MSNSCAETEFQNMPIKPETNDHGMLEIYKQLMLVDLFQTHYGSWMSNLPVHLKVLMAAMMLLLLTGITFGVYYTHLSWDKIKRQMTELKETFTAVFSYEEEAPVKVLTVKDGTRAHEFFDD